MSFRTKHLPLTEDQKKRGAIYSSVLIVTNKPGFKECTHEVLESDPGKREKIERLKDVSFFKSFARNAGLNVINEVRGV